MISVAKFFMLIIIAISVPENIFSQNILPFEIKLNLQEGNIKKAKISITKNGEPWKLIYSEAKCKLELDLGAEYIITAAKNGYITKSIVIDRHIPEGRNKEKFAKFISKIILQQQPEGETITYTKPVAEIIYNKNVGDFDLSEVNYIRLICK